MTAVTVSPKFQVVIPLAVRRRLASCLESSCMWCSSAIASS